MATAAPHTPPLERDNEAYALDACGGEYPVGGDVLQVPLACPPGSREAAIRDDPLSLLPGPVAAWANRTERLSGIPLMRLPCSRFSPWLTGRG